MRTLFAAVVLVVLPALATGQNQKPDYYPFVKGNKWEFRVQAGGNTVEATTEVIKIESKDGTTTATLEIRVAGMDMATTETITTSAKGMTRQALGGLRLAAPITMMKFPVKAGDSWTEKATVNNVEIEIRARVGEEVELKLPAGTYKAVPVNMEVNLAGQTMRMANWYADGVGIVRQSIEAPGLTAVSELTKFTPAKAK